MNTNIFEDIVNSVLCEYSSDQRLPFDDDYFKNKNYLEQYADWLEDFGKYGELPSSKLNFWSEINKAIKYIIDNGLRNHRGLGLSDNHENILKRLYNIIDNSLTFDSRNNLYVERQVVISDTAKSYDKSDGGIDPKILYNTLVSNYNNNVGGCWSYKSGCSESYCSDENGDSITLKGYIMLDDIDFVKTVLLNFHYPEEHEIRVKPNAKVELFEVDFNGKYKIPLRGSLIVNSTYFGNNGKFKGDYAPVDNGFGHCDYIDRHGNIRSLNDISKDRVKNGLSVRDIFDNVGKFNEYGFARVELNNRDSFIRRDGSLIYDGDLWFDLAFEFVNDFAEVRLKDKYSFLSSDGKLIGDGKLWFDDVNTFNQYGFAEVKNGVYSSFIDKNGNLIYNGELWFDFIYDFNDNGLAKVELNSKYSFINHKCELIGDGKLWFDYAGSFNNGFSEVKLNNRYSYLNSKGELIGNGELWFDNTSGFLNGFAEVELNGKYSFINSEHELIGNGKLWFDEVYGLFNDYGIARVGIDDSVFIINGDGDFLGSDKMKFDNIGNFKYGFAKVKLNDKFSYIDTNGNLIFNGKLWFDNASMFKDGYAVVSLNNRNYQIDTNFNFYDLDTKQPTNNPFNNTNENSIMIKNALQETLNLYLKDNIYKI